MGQLASVICLLVAASIVLGGSAATAASGRRAAMRYALGGGGRTNGARALPGLLPWPVRVLARVGSTRVARGLCRFERIRRRYDLAGRPLTPEAFTGIKLLIAGACVLPCFMAGLPLLVALPLAPALACATVRVPDIVLARMARGRQRRIGDRVPDLVEVLVATTDAGLSPMVAFRRAAQAMSGPLGEELRESGRADGPRRVVARRDGAAGQADRSLLTP
jgi:hypothetical protein